MKRIIALLLALVLACGMGMAAFAGEVTIRTDVPERHTVTVEADGGRVIADNKVCTGTVLVERQKSQTYWLVPDGGKVLQRLCYNGEDVTAQMVGATFTAPPLTEDSLLQAFFADAPSTGGGSTVGGTVTDEDGNPMPGVTVEIGGNTGDTDEDGNFIIPDVPPGTYPVVITDEEGNIIAIVEITIGEPEDEGPTVTEDENGNLVIVPGPGDTNIDLDIVVRGDGSADVVDVDIYTRDPYLDDPGTGVAPVENGSATVTLADGTRVTVTGLTQQGLWLVIRRITEPELVAWFEQCLAPHGTNVYPMDIYFVDSRGVRTEVTGLITVVVETPWAYAEPIACYVAPDGAVAVLASSVNGRAVTFQTGHNSYYALAEKLPTAAASQQGAATTPPTGDGSNPWLWGAAMLLAGCGLAALWLWRGSRRAAR